MDFKLTATIGKKKGQQLNSKSITIRDVFSVEQVTDAVKTEFKEYFDESQTKLEETPKERRKRETS